MKTRVRAWCVRGRIRSSKAPHDLPVILRHVAVAELFRAAEARVRWRRLALFVLAGQQSAREREIWKKTHPMAFDSRHQLALDSPVEEAVLVLGGHEPGEVLRSGDILRLVEPWRRQVGTADVADLALLHEAVERLKCLHERR